MGQLIFNLAGTHMGSALVDIGHALFVTSILAAMISFHNTTARYAFALGRERVLPAALGRTSRAGAPIVGSLLQTGIGFVVIVTYALAGWDPVVQLFFWGGTSGGLGSCCSSPPPRSPCWSTSPADRLARLSGGGRSLPPSPRSPCCSCRCSRW